MGKKKTENFDVKEKLDNIQTLARTNRPKEAVAYEYMLFVMLCSLKYRQRKEPYESVRDYAMTMVKEHDLSPGNLYPFIQKVEDAIYGGKGRSQEVYAESLEYFNKVFNEIVGKPLPESMLVHS